MRYYPLLSALVLSAPLSLTCYAAEADSVFSAFEGDGFDTWQTKGTAFGDAPAAGGTGTIKGKVTGFSQDGFASSFQGSEKSTGSLISPEFKISQNFIHFLVAGTKNPKGAAIQLLVDGKVVYSATGKGHPRFSPQSWDVKKFKGKTAQIQIVDSSDKSYILIDHIAFSNSPSFKYPATHANFVMENNLVPSKEHRNLKIPANSQLEIVADHDSHGLTSPTALCQTESGDILVAETWRFMAEQGIDDNRKRRHWIPEDLASQTTADRLAMYKRWYHKHPPEHYTRNSEKIRRLFDSNNDGTFDANNIYAEGFNDPLDGTAAGIFQYRDTTYFACIPHIWALKDEDKDGVAEKRKSLQDGFGVRVSFSGHDLNGFALGPDGRIYSTIGDRGFNITTKEGKQYVYPGQGAVIRFEPDGSNMEVIHTGLRNPKEIAFDQYGNAITVDNNSDQGDLARVVYVMDGGDSGWRMGHQVLHSFHQSAGLANKPINRWMAEKMWSPQNDSQPASILPPILNLTYGPSGLTFDPGTGAHPDFTNCFLVCDYRGAAARSGIQGFSIEPDGASMKVSSVKQFNEGAASSDVEYGFDGKIYVADFVGGWSTHAAGRIFTITPDNPVNAEQAKEVAPLIKQGIHNLPTEKLASLLEHPDMRLRTRAHIVLAERKETKLLVDLLDKFEKEGKLIPTLHTVWSLGIIARKDIDQQYTAGGPLVRLAMGAKQEEVRVQALKCLGDIPYRMEKQSLSFQESLSSNSDRVKLFAATGLSKHAAPDGHTRLCHMLKSKKEVNPYLLNAAALALKNNSTPEQLLKLKDHESSNVRLAAVIALSHFKHPGLTEYLLDKDQQVSYEAIRAIFDQELKDLMPKLNELLPLEAGKSTYPHKLTAMMQRRLIHSAFRTGGDDNIKRLVAFAADKKMDHDQRIEALRLLYEWEEPFLINQALGKYSPLPKRPVQDFIKTLSEAVPVLVGMEDFIVAPTLRLLDHYQIKSSNLTPESLAAIATNSKMDPEVRSSALTMLASQDAAQLLSIAPELADSKNETIACQALESIAKVSQEKALPLLIKACDHKATAVQQTAWRLLGQINSKQAHEKIIAGVNALSDGKSYSSSALEILDGARKIDTPSAKQAITKYESSVKDKPLGAFLPSLYGGDVQRGADIFESNGAAQCMRCHTVGYGHKAGGDAGPNLAGIANRRSHLDLLKSLVEPSAQLAPGYGTVSLTFKNGKTVSATLLDEDETSVTITLGDATHKIDRKEISSMSTSPSAMPPMNDALSPYELRDMVAYLSSLKSEKGKPKSKPPVITPLDIEKLPELKQDDHGKLLYQATCSACHQDDGKGILGAFPPLAESEWVNGPVDNLIRIQLRGLQGPITVKGVEYNNVMPPNAAQTDEDIAAVLTYIRSNFGNNAGKVTAGQVKALRGEVGKPLLKADDLKKP